jgi:hypothetical protein
VTKVLRGESTIDPFVKVATATIVCRPFAAVRDCQRLEKVGRAVPMSGGDHDRPSMTYSIRRTLEGAETLDLRVIHDRTR